MPKTNKPSNRLEEIRELENQIHRCLLLATSMPNTLSDEQAIHWINETVKKIMPTVESSIRQAVEEALGSVELEEKIYEDIDGSYNLLRAEGYNQAVEDQFKKHKEVLEKK